MKFINKISNIFLLVSFFLLYHHCDLLSKDKDCVRVGIINLADNENFTEFSSKMQDKYKAINKSLIEEMEKLQDSYNKKIKDIEQKKVILDS